MAATLNAANIQITLSASADGRAWIVSVDGKFTDIGIKVTDRYRIYKRDGECGLALADKLGDMIGWRIVQSPKTDRQTTRAAFLEAIAATL